MKLKITDEKLDELFLCPWCNRRYLTLEAYSHICSDDATRYHPVIIPIDLNEVITRTKWNSLTEEQIGLLK